ncbi:carbohydrate ABC transporter permease [Candidatus Aerophobetes bacterium]|nr:carbohydrate ABC transporter permease [Candidatus Aerophobetes bacterium]
MKRRSKSLAYYIGLLPFVVFALFPFYWMVITSLKKKSELYSLMGNPFIIQKGITWENFSFLFNQTLFTLWYKNAVVTAVLATALSVGVSVLAAYALARLKFRGSQFFGIAIFFSYLVPPALLFVSLFDVINFFGLADNVYSLILAYPTFAIPFSTWLLMGYFSSIPREIEESAMVDGATRLQTITKIILPVAIPGIITSALFSFALCWSSLIYPLAFLSSGTQKVLTSGLITDLIRGDVFYWGSLMAAATLATVPIVIMYTLAMEYFVSGLVQGAVKY